MAWRRAKQVESAESPPPRGLSLASVGDVFRLFVSLHTPLPPKFWNEVAAFAIRVVDSKWRWESTAYCAAARHLPVRILRKPLPYDDSGVVGSLTMVPFLDLFLDRIPVPGDRSLDRVLAAVSETDQRRKIVSVVHPSGGGKSRIAFDLGRIHRVPVLFIRVATGGSEGCHSLPFQAWLTEVARWPWRSIGPELRVDLTQAALQLLCVLFSCYVDFASASLAVIQALYDVSSDEVCEFLLRLFRNGTCEAVVASEFQRRKTWLASRDEGEDEDLIPAMVFESIQVLRGLCGGNSIVCFFDEVQALVNVLQVFCSFSAVSTGSRRSPAPELHPAARPTTEAPRFVRLGGSSSALLRDLLATTFDRGGVVPMKPSDRTRFRDAHSVLGMLANFLFQDERVRVVLAGTFLQLDEEDTTGFIVSPIRGISTTVGLTDNFDSECMIDLLSRYFAWKKPLLRKRLHRLRLLNGRPHWFVDYVLAKFRFSFFPEDPLAELVAILDTAVDDAATDIAAALKRILASTSRIRGVSPAESVVELVLSLSTGSSSHSLRFSALQHRLLSIVVNRTNKLNVTLSGFVDDVPVLRGLLKVRGEWLTYDIEDDPGFASLVSQARASSLDPTAKGKVLELMLVWLLLRLARKSIVAEDVFELLGVSSIMLASRLLANVFVRLTHAVDAHRPDYAFESMTPEQCAVWASVPWDDGRDRGLPTPNPVAVSRSPPHKRTTFDFLFDSDGRPVLDRIVFSRKDDDETGPDVVFMGCDGDGRLWLFVAQAKATVKSSLRESLRTLNPGTMGEALREWLWRNEGVFEDRVVRIPLFAAPFRDDTVAGLAFLNRDPTTLRLPEAGVPAFARAVQPIGGLVLPVGADAFGSGATKLLKALTTRADGIQANVMNIEEGIPSPLQLWRLTVPRRALVSARPWGVEVWAEEGGTGPAGGGGRRGREPWSARGSVPRSPSPLVVPSVTAHQEGLARAVRLFGPGRDRVGRGMGTGSDDGSAPLRS